MKFFNSQQSDWSVAAVRTVVAMALGVSVAVTSTAFANDSAADFPKQPVRLIVPFSAGGGIDMLARITAEKMGEKLGQNVIVQNQGGGGGVVASRSVVQAPADGYTLVFHSVSSAVVNATVRNDLGYDAMKDFAPVSLVAQFPLVMIVNPSVPAKTLPEFLELLKKNPEGYSYGSSGVGSGIHLAGELFSKLAGVQIQHVPYKGTSAALTDVLGGRVSMLIDGVPPQVQNINSGRVRALAVTTTQRSEVLPDVPTMIEAGVDGYDIPFWVAIYAPAGTPEPIVKKLSDAVHFAVTHPDSKERLKAAGAVGIGSTPEELDEFWKQQFDMYANIVKMSNIELN